MHAVLDGEDWRASIATHAEGGEKSERAVRAMLAAYQAEGVTYLRDGGDRWGACLLAKRLAPEYGIAYAAPYAPLYKKGNYGSFIGRGYENLKEYEALVDEMATAGADFIKVMLSGIMDFSHYGVISGFALDKGLVRDLVAVAHDRGMPVMGHVNGARAIQDAVEAGIDSVEHGAFSDEESRACLAESDAIWVPTVSPVANLVGSGVGDDTVLRSIAEDHAEALRWVAGHGGTIALGDDAGARGVPHGHVSESELEHMRRALGPDADAVLERGTTLLAERFAPRA